MHTLNGDVESIECISLHTNPETGSEYPRVMSTTCISPYEDMRYSDVLFPEVLRLIYDDSGKKINIIEEIYNNHYPSRGILSRPSVILGTISPRRSQAYILQGCPQHRTGAYKHLHLRFAWKCNRSKCKRMSLRKQGCGSHKRRADRKQII